MRSWLGPMIGLLAGLVVGCASEPMRSTAWLDRFRHGAAPSGPDVVQLDVGLIERPLGDRFLNAELWEAVDETISLESKEALASNGFRVGQIGGITPPGLRELLTSPRSCSNPRRLHVHAGQPVKFDLGPEATVCRFQLQRDGVAVPVQLERAQFLLEVVPTLLADGRIQLHFQPGVQHGSASLLPQPAPDRSGWLLTSERPTERYPGLSGNVTLAASEYIVIGGRFNLPQSLGHQTFIRRDEPVPVQRLLVIRSGRTTAPADETADLMADPDRAPRSPCVASQAASSIHLTARGRSD